MTIPLAKELQNARSFSQLANCAESKNPIVNGFVEKHVSAITAELIRERENSHNPACVPNWKLRYSFAGKGMPLAAKSIINDALLNAGYNVKWTMEDDVYIVIISWEEFR